MNSILCLLIAGSRTYDNYDKFSVIVKSVIKSYDCDKVIIVSGGARGADKLAERFAGENNYEINVFNADWDTYGKRAGFIRNYEMHEFIKQFSDRACLCFWDGSSRGTQQNFKLAKERNTNLFIYSYNDDKFICA